MISAVSLSPRSVIQIRKNRFSTPVANSALTSSSSADWPVASGSPQAPVSDPASSIGGSSGAELPSAP